MKKKKYIIFCVVLLIVAVSCILFFILRKEKEANFSNNIGEVMDDCMWLTDNNKDNIKIKSIDAYYIDDDDKIRKIDYFYHIVYSIFRIEDEEWHPINVVYFGVDGDVGKHFSEAEFAKNSYII